MLLQFVIPTSLVLLVTAATTKDSNTKTTEGSSTIIPSTIDDSYTTEDSFTTESIVICKDNEWQCRNGDCVFLDQLCDGAFHCEDGSDETRANCKGWERPMLGLVLHCLADRQYNIKDGVCPDICNVQPEYCAYALLADNGSEGACALPDFISNGTYRITNLNRTSHYGGLNDFYLDFVCDRGTELVGEAKPQCLNGTWASRFPYCSDTCNLTKRPKSYKYTCRRGEKTYECGEFVAIGTEVLVAEPGDKIANANIVAHTMCTDERTLNASSQCVEVVEDQQGSFEKKIMNELSDFEDKFKTTKQPSFAFEELVRNYRIFETYVAGNSSELSRQISVCNINLDLMLMDS